MWLNGEVVQTSAPPPPSPPPTPPKPGAKPGEATAPEPEMIDIDQLLGRTRSKTEKRFRIGLRQGENEIVLKVVFAGAAGPARPGPVIGVPNAVVAGPGGGAFTFNITPEGDDVVTHEVVTALRLETEERTKTAQAPGTSVAPAAQPAPGPVAETKELPSAPDSRRTAEVAIGETDVAVKPDEPKKVSLVGAKSAA